MLPLRATPDHAAPIVPKLADPGTAVVTGAAGFIGARLASTLIRQGWTVRGVDDGSAGDWTRTHDDVQRHDDDLTRLSVPEMEALCDGADVVFHLAAEKYNSPASTPESLLATNVQATDRLYSAAGRVGVSKIVFTSSLYAYGSVGPKAMVETDLPAPTTRYGMTKIAGEHLLRVVERDFGVRWTAARVFFVYGPHQHVAGGYRSVIMSNFARILGGERPQVNGDGRQTLDYVFVDDCVDALLRMLAPKADSMVLNVSSGRGISIADLTSMMLAVANATLEPQFAPRDWTQGTHRVGCPSRTREVIDWSASTSIEDGLQLVWTSMAPR